MKNKRVKQIAYIGVFSALATVAMLFKVPVPWAPAFYKLELSEVVCLVGGYLLGAPAALAIEIIKILINFLIDGTTTAGVGELSNLLMGCSFVIPATIIYRRRKNMVEAIMGVVVGTVCLAVSSCLLNYFVLIPMYATLFGTSVEAIVGMGKVIFPSINNLWSFVLTCVLTFNIVKGLMSSILGLLLFKAIPDRIKNTL
ncbi:MAG: ECF transporter S component [Clostridia bacterium]|nr:ECF transporter S component [Clostridia bacterium]